MDNPIMKPTQTPSVAQMKLALNKQGMYSPLEKAAMAVPRTKGTPAEFMAEISKQPGFRKDEVEDRKISLPKQKMTKDEFLSHVRQNHPSPKLDESIYHGEDEDEGDQTQYSEYQLPGGQNYREVLLKTPTFSPSKDRQIMELEANIRRMNPEDYPPGYVQNMIDGVNKLKAEKAAMGSPYQSSHWRDDPNVLAHMRLSDRYVGDTGQFAVMGTKGGKTKFLFQTGINGTPEQARQAAKKFEDQGYETSINQVGGGKKLLHVEEIQSDWHQQGRKEGYKSGDEQKRIDAVSDEYNNLTLRRRNLIREAEETRNSGPVFLRMMDEIGEITPRLMELEQKMDSLRKTADAGVPDAPFKKNWHELALKHALGMAAKGGYDGIVITPGQQQAERYDLSKHVNELFYKKNPDGTYSITAQGKDLGNLIEETLPADKLQNFVGKELTDKIIGGQGKSIEVEGPYDYVTGRSSKEQMQSLSGLDLKVGGEGMKGFYDKMLPDYLNKLGKPHGAQVQMNAVPVTAAKNKNADADDQLLSDLGVQTPQATQQMLHYFPITDSMRQQIKTEGLPQYNRGGKVKSLDHFFESSDSLDHFFQE